MINVELLDKDGNRLMIHYNVTPSESYNAPRKTARVVIWLGTIPVGNLVIGDPDGS